MSATRASYCKKGGRNMAAAVNVVWFTAVKAVPGGMNLHINLNYGTYVCLCGFQTHVGLFGKWHMP